MSQVVETESTVSLPISPATALAIINRMGPYEAITKEVHGELRQITETNRILYQRKYVVERISAMVASQSHIYMVENKRAVEEEVTPEYFASVLSFAEPVVVKKHVVWDANRLRWSVNEYCNSQTYKLEIERESSTMEYEPHSLLVDYMERSSHYGLLVYAFGETPLPLQTLLQYMWDDARNFVYSSDEPSVTFAPKLDGTKYAALIQHDSMLIPQLNICHRLSTSIFIGQTIRGSVEFVNGMTILIDVHEIYSSHGSYCTVGILEACSLIEHYLSRFIPTNRFFDSPDKALAFAEHHGYPIDGYLSFSKNSIQKHKTQTTIDLLYHTNRVHKKTPVEESLFFLDNETLASQGYLVEGPLDVPIGKDFIVIEFHIDAIRKRLKYFRTRTDKHVPNTLSTFLKLAK